MPPIIRDVRMSNATAGQAYALQPTGGQRVAGKKQVALASLGLRCGAFLLDYILTMLVLALTVLVAYYIKRRWEAPELANFVLLLGYLLTAGVLFLNLVFYAER